MTSTVVWSRPTWTSTWGDFIFDTFQPFHFYKNEEVDYCIPKGEGGKVESNRDVYVDAIETLPLANTPDVFGLHPNAEIGYYTNSAKVRIWNKGRYVMAAMLEVFNTVFLC